MPRKPISLSLAFFFAALFSSWAAYRIHILAIEEFALPILDAVLNFEGRAPDQYRLIPYAVLRLIAQGIETIFAPVSGLRIPLLVFDTTCLFLSAFALRRLFPMLEKTAFFWGFFLIYPFLIFDGYRPISAFILLACLFVLRALLRARAQQKGGIVLVIFSVIILAFTRADVAFLYAVSALALVSLSLPLQILLLCIPVAAQATLSFVLFPDAEYFSEVFMLTRNFTSPLILLSPLTSLVVALGIAYRHEMAQLTRFT